VVDFLFVIIKLFARYLLRSRRYKRSSDSEDRASIAASRGNKPKFVNDMARTHIHIDYGFEC